MLVNLLPHAVMRDGCASIARLYPNHIAVHVNAASLRRSFSASPNYLHVQVALSVRNHHRPAAKCSASSAYGSVSYVCARPEIPYPVLALLRIFSVTSIRC